jgi:hypothetical protein
VWLTLYVFISASTSPSDFEEENEEENFTVDSSFRVCWLGEHEENFTVDSSFRVCLASMRKTFFSNVYCQRSEKQHQRIRNKTECGEHILVAISWYLQLVYEIAG